MASFGGCHVARMAFPAHHIIDRDRAKLSHGALRVIVVVDQCLDRARPASLAREALSRENSLRIGKRC